ncbi:MAG: hypothetical protein K6U02_08370, partial [Firmicutes bacterium]|nr:hypothetical protein [Bacillota bacterium]
MSDIRLEPDAHAPTVAIELPLVRPLEDYDLAEVERESTRAVDEILVSQGFRDLVDDARAALQILLEGAPLELVQLTGQICKAGPRFRPGLWLLLRERGAADGQPASAAAREHAAHIASE